MCNAIQSGCGVSFTSGITSVFGIITGFGVIIRFVYFADTPGNLNQELGCQPFRVVLHFLVVFFDYPATCRVICIYGVS